MNKKVYFTPIPVSDLLVNPSIHDTIELTNIFSEHIAWLTKLWISWTIHIQWMDAFSIHLILENIICFIDTMCDKCWKDIIQRLLCKKAKAIYCFEDNIDAMYTQKKDEHIFIVDRKNTSIDIEQFVVESLHIEQEIVSICSDCQKIDR